MSNNNPRVRFQNRNRLPNRIRLCRLEPLECKTLLAADMAMSILPTVKVDLELVEETSVDLDSLQQASAFARIDLDDLAEQNNDSAQVENIGASASPANDAFDSLFDKIGSKDLEVMPTLPPILGAEGIGTGGDMLPGKDLIGDGGLRLDDISDALGDDESGLPDLGFMPEPTTPNKTPANTRGGPSRAPTGPSYNPADWLSGLASEEDPTASDGNPNTISASEESYDPETGTFTIITRTGYLDTATIRVVIANAYADGGLTITEFYIGDDGEIQSKAQSYGAADVQITRLPGTEGGSGDGVWARWLADLTGVRPDLSIPNPDQVNPGQADDSGPEVSRIDPGESIVVNPAGESVQARQVSEARAEHWKEELLERAGGLVNPERP